MLYSGNKLREIKLLAHGPELGKREQSFALRFVCGLIVKEPYSSCRSFRGRAPVMLSRGGGRACFLPFLKKPPFLEQAHSL